MIAVSKRDWFEHHEAAEIKTLIDELRHADAHGARAVCSRLRAEYGFYVGGYVAGDR